MKMADINTNLEKFKVTPGAVLIDARSEAEYRSGRIPGSMNLPLQRMPEALKLIPDKDTPVFIYCTSGGRSNVAASFLTRSGYTAAVNIGGLNAYKGEIER
ncbi:MAG TPA: rhodanese-like domain-containing protein [Bacillota bacterium]|nr:rhodanese-like domain-containing protein [Bacillota bacterium]